MANSFELFNKELVIEDDFLLDILLHGDICKIATQASKDFETYYHDKFSCLEDILKKGEEAALNIFRKQAQNYVNILISLGIPFISVSDILHQTEAEYFEDALDDLEVWYNSSKEKEKQQAIYRKARRKNRSKVVIRGRTLTGAIAGAMTAGTLNLASGVVHGTANVVGNSFSSMASSITKSSMFSNPNTCQQFCNAVYMDVFEWVYIVEDLIEEAYVPIRRITVDDEETCESFRENLCHAKLNQGQSYELAFQLFQLNPSEFSYYELCFEKFPEQQVNLLKLAEYCRVDLSPAIDAVFQNMFRSFPHKTEEDVKELREKMQQKQGELGVTSSPVIDKVDKMLADFDIKARSFQGTAFETRELRQKAERDFDDLTTLCGKIDKLELNDCKNLQQEISQKEYVPEISEIFLTRIERRAKKLERDEADQLYKTLFAQYEVENSSLKKYKIMEKVMSVVNILVGLLFFGSLSLTWEACSSGSLMGTIVSLLISCSIPFICVRWIDDPWERKKKQIEGVMPQDLLDAKERKETTQQAYDKMIAEMQKEQNS